MKNLRLLLLTRPLSILGLTAVFLLTVGIAVVATLSTREAAEAGNRYSTTHDALLEMNGALASLAAAEDAGRADESAGLEALPAARAQAIVRFKGHLARLQQIFSNVPAHQTSVDQISGLANSGTDADTMSTLREAVLSLQRHELAALTFDSAFIGHRAEFFRRIVLELSIAACLLGGAGIVLFIRRTSRLENIVTVCAWTKRVKVDDSWVTFEEYFQERYNLQFTHGISEEAAIKLREEMNEIVESESHAFQRVSSIDSTPPMADISVHPASIRAA